MAEHDVALLGRAVRSHSRASRTSRADKEKKRSFVDRFRASMSVAEPLRSWSPTGSRTRLVLDASHAQPQPPLPPVRAHEEVGVARRDGEQAAPAEGLLLPASALGFTGSGGGGGGGAEAWREPHQVCSPRCSPARPVGSSPERSRVVPRPELKVGIVLMTRRPHRFDFWLAYHRAVGICHFFVHVEDTPALLEELRCGEHADVVTATEGAEEGAEASGSSSSSNNYYTLMQRQEHHVRAAVSACRERGIEWLFHVSSE